MRCRAAPSSDRPTCSQAHHLKHGHQRTWLQSARPTEDAVVALRRTGYLTDMGSGWLWLELGQLLVADVDDVVAELAVQQLELLAGHKDGRVAAARAGHQARPHRNASRLHGLTGQPPHFPPPGWPSGRGR